MSDEDLIRPASPADVGTIGEIAEATDLFPAADLAPMIAPFLTRSARDRWFVVERTGALVAFAFCEPERMTQGTWNLLAIGVRPDQQGQGIGGRLLADVEEGLRAAGERILLVETMGTPELARTRAFYRAHDYTEEARIREFYEPGADKVVFWKKLAWHAE